MAVEMITLKSREDWLKRRTSYIGGSDAASVLGLNPWRSNAELWEIKTGRRKQEDISEKSFVKYGHDAEPYLRALFALDFPEYEVEYVDNNMWLNDKYPWAHSSLDGWLTEKGTGRRGVLEIKTTNIMRAGQRDEWKDKIPTTYFCQVLHYMLVCEFDFAIVKAQLKTEIEDDVFLTTKHYKIERSDVEQDIELLRVESERFYEAIITDTRPALILPEI